MEPVVPVTGELAVVGVTENVQVFADCATCIDVPATVNLHGQTRPVTVHYEAKRDGAALIAHGKFHINMTDFGITVPSYLGVTVKPDVDVSADFHVAGS